jgi:MazG family protein
VIGRLYPADHPIGMPGRDDGRVVSSLAADDLRLPLYLAPVAPSIATATPWSLPWISDRLRAPDGCPWDREQTHESLRKHLLEEAYEVYDALEGGATPALAEELGDLLLQVVLHAQLAAEAGVFDLADVQAAIARKIVRRHPHVFGDAVARTAADVNRQWERIKAGERETAAREAAERDGAGGAVDTPAQPKSALDGISPSMPALAAGQEMQERAAALGYNWPDVEGVLDKVAEELAELARAGTDAERHEEFGDLRCLDTPISESAIVGVSIGAALRGYRPVAEMQFGDFITCGFDQIVNQAATLRYRYGGRAAVPIVVTAARKRVRRHECFLAECELAEVLFVDVDDDLRLACRSEQQQFLAGLCDVAGFDAARDQHAVGGRPDDGGAEILCICSCKGCKIGYPQYFDPRQGKDKPDYTQLNAEKSCKASKQR